MLREVVAQKTSRKPLGAEPSLLSRSASDKETEDDMATAGMLAHWQHRQAGRGLFVSHPKRLRTARDQRRHEEKLNLTMVVSLPSRSWVGPSQ